MNYIKRLFQGRINRGTFFLGFVLSVIPGFLALFGGFLSIVGFILYGFYLTSIGLRRLHDMGHGGWWFLLAIPPLTPFIIIYLILNQGQPNANQYGEPQVKQSFLNALINQ